jgi:hypothetical protein
LPFLRPLAGRPLVLGIGGVCDTIDEYIGAQSRRLDSDTPIDCAEERIGSDLKRLQPFVQGCCRAGRIGTATWDGDLGAFTLCVDLRALDEQLQPASRLRHMDYVEADQLGAPQRAGKAEEEPRTVSPPAEFHPARSAQPLDVCSRQRDGPSG